MISGNTINLEPMTDKRKFVSALRRKRQSIMAQLRRLSDSDILKSETLTRKLELINCMIAEFK
jgi:hypothetical protein